MSWRHTLRSLPIAYRGELHEVELVQFSLDPEEAQELLPPPLVARQIAGRALVSLVNVQLHRMHPTFVPGLVSFSYRHVAFRLLVTVPTGTIETDGTGGGIFFVQSFTDRPLLARAGSLLTHYRLGAAEIEVDPRGLAVRQDGRRLSYRKAVLGAEAAPPGLFADWAAARAAVGGLDRAYAVDARGGVWRTRIRRPDWPLEPLPLAGFATDFFASARLECAFRVPRVVPYDWLAPELVLPASSP